MPNTKSKDAKLIIDGKEYDVVANVVSKDGDTLVVILMKGVMV